MYFSIMLDRTTKVKNILSEGISVLYSDKGGVDIEKSASSTLQKKTLNGEKLETIIDSVINTLEIQNIENAEECLTSIIKTFFDNQATLIEINPLVVTISGKLMPLDAKIQLDDNSSKIKNLTALFAQKNEHDKSKKARENNLNYIELDGNIGCLVNGAGLAMATMDSIKQEGGEPANFMDVGGNATAKQVSEAVKILLMDEKVKNLTCRLNVYL